MELTEEQDSLENRNRVSRTIYVRNIRSDVDEERFKRHFSEIGSVVYCKIIEDPSRFTVYGYVEFANRQAAQKALAMDGDIFAGLQLKLSPSTTAIKIPKKLRDGLEAMAEYRKRGVDTALEVLSAKAKLVNNETGLLEMVKDIERGCGNTPETGLYVDVEGISLSRDGQACLVQIYFTRSAYVYLIDLIEFPSAFNAQKFALKKIFEGESHCKVIFDPRNDVDALYHQFKVYPRNVTCLQLADVASRRAQEQTVEFVSGLVRVMEKCIKLPVEQLNMVKAIKAVGSELFQPEHGGSYAVFLERPLRQEIINYSSIDVFFFPCLVEKLWTPLSDEWKYWVVRESKIRVDAHQDPNYISTGRQRAIAPI
eukprot:Lithocolla_globosa_v1_NODE_3381_length_1686_cov_23.747394.p1 type:complete len:368 gc:universal NODE_3381_length_1686_cov_23.747394:419-1522(+)